MTDSKVEFVGKELIQSNPLTLNSKALRPGANHLQLTLQIPNLSRGVLQFGHRLLQFAQRLPFLIPAPLEMVQSKTDGGKGQETGEAVPIPNYLIRVFVVGEHIYKKPTCPAQSCHTERPEPPHIPAANADRDEVKHKEEEFVACSVVNIAHGCEAQETHHADLQRVQWGALRRGFRMRLISCHTLPVATSSTRPSLLH